MPASPETVAVAFGRAVRRLRGAAGLSQEELADRMDVARTYVVDVEHGRRNVTIRNVARFAKALDTSVGQLMRTADEEAPKLTP